ncbi:hypothetical protein CBL_03513 [Carabus blaptoides fortunei]
MRRGVEHKAPLCDMQTNKRAANYELLKQKKKTAQQQTTSTKHCKLASPVALGHSWGCEAKRKGGFVIKVRKTVKRKGDRITRRMSGFLKAVFSGTGLREKDKNYLPRCIFPRRPDGPVPAFSNLCSLLRPDSFPFTTMHEEAIVFSDHCQLKIRNSLLLADESSNVKLPNQNRYLVKDEMTISLRRGRKEEEASGLGMEENRSGREMETERFLPVVKTATELIYHTDKDEMIFLLQCKQSYISENEAKVGAGWEWNGLGAWAQTTCTLLMSVQCRFRSRNGSTGDKPELRLHGQRRSIDIGRCLLATSGVHNGVNNGVDMDVIL